MPSDKRPRVEIARAVLRLRTETVVPVEQVSAEAQAHSRALVRWITGGKHGVYLDGLHRPGIGWMTSRAALDRFRAALALAGQKSGAAGPDRSVGGGA